ncbi:MAG: glycoside hydrolase family 88 protein [Gemmiger sp.]|nr:glycoside hydrolase family 88 protein [Gemmiger sp.]
MQQAVRQVAQNLPAFESSFPAANSEHGFYTPGINTDWTTGFWTGEVWLAYENAQTPEQKAMFLSAGEKQVDSFLERMNIHHYVDHHDMGFLYSPSCVAAYKLTGSPHGKEAALKAADQLLTRYRPEGEYLQAWGPMNARDNSRLIIDCLLNIPLLYWASETTGDASYRTIAEKHIHTAMKYIVRADDSTWHTIFFDPDTGAFDHGATCQGYQDASAWARGQTWGIYGTAIAYKNTRRAEYIDYFHRVSRYFLSHLPDDLCPYWDLMFGNGDEADQPRDSSSAAIAACGFLEMSKYLPAEDAAYYTGMAKRLVKALIDHYQVKDFAISNGQLLHGTYAKKTPYNTCKNSGVDECVIWGDYYFMEALTRLQNPEWDMYW